MRRIDSIRAARAAHLTVRQAAALAALREAALLVGASLFVAVCARFTLPLPFTPVPLTLQNFAVLLVGLALGPSRAFAALLLYLAEGAAGMPVFNPVGPGGVAQLVGPTGGYLLAYPVVAMIAGLASRAGAAGSTALRREPPQPALSSGLEAHRSGRELAVPFVRALLACTLAEVVLFACGIAWFSFVAHVPPARALVFTLYPFCFAEVIKIMAASALAPRAGRLVNNQ